MRKKIITVSIVGIMMLVLSSFKHKDLQWFEKEDNEIIGSYCDIENTSFQAGEEVTYKLYYNWNFVWMSAGEVTFKVNDEGSKYHISVVGKTLPSYEWFYKVRDKYDTYIDKQTLLPTTSIRDIKEGDYKLYDKVTFDQNVKVATSWRGDNANETVKRTYKLNDCMHDMVSMIYFSRNINYDQMQTGDKFPVKIFLDKDIYSLNVKFKGKEKKKHIKESGVYNTIKFSPNIVKSETFKDGSEMNIWVSDDANKIPVLIESPLSVGSVKAILKSYKGLKHPFTAKAN